MQSESHPLTAEAEDDALKHLQPDNPLEKLTMDVKRRLKALQDRMKGKGPPKELSPEERKVSQMAEIIQTYRHVELEKLDEDAELPPLVDRPIFDLIFSLAIVVNTIIIGLEVDASYKKDKRDAVWIVVEILFVLIFWSEVIAKVYVHTWKWILMDGWNFFTLFIALLAAVDGFILSPLGLHGKLRMLSLLRVIGMLRLLRVIRTYKGLKELRLVMQGLMGSMGMLTWTVLILVIFLYVAAVFTTASIGRSDVYADFKKMTNGWDADELFGSVGKSMYTLMQCTTRDSWSSSIARFVVVRQWYMAFFFIFFIMLSTYGLLNLVVSVIVEQTLNAARSNENRMRAREERERKGELDTLKEIFIMADEDGSGELDIAEFMNCIKDDDILVRFRQLDLPIDDAARLFTVIDGDGARPLNITEFIDGCQKLKGAARSRDLLAITAQADTLSKKMDDLGEELQDSERMLHALDEISVRITQRFVPAMKGSRKKIAKSVGGSAPVVPMHPEKLGTAIGVDLAAGNRPLMPKFPNLLN